MTSPRTPRQWTEADIVDWPNDHPDVKDRRGTTWRWYPERDFYVTDWNEAASWMQLCKNLGPLSEVPPETPEPPREEGKQRCGSCDHLVTDHGDGGCYYTVTIGTIDGDLVCQCTVPAPQSVTAVPVSSTGGKETGEAAETGTGSVRATLKRDGLASFILGSAAVPSRWADALAIADAILAAGWRPPEPDGETEWAERSKITGRTFVTSEQYARGRVNLFPSELDLIRREVGPWIEVTS